MASARTIATRRRRRTAWLSGAEVDDESIKAAEKAAKEFLARLAAWRKAEGKPPAFIGTKHSGAVRRASMDLTRALADMRRPG